MSQEYIESSDGAFKKVAIYEHYVVKSVKTWEDYNSDEACEDEFNFDEYGEFDEGLAFSRFENGINDSYNEMQKEYEYNKCKKHLPIIVPITKGDIEEYTMPRVKTYSEVDTSLPKKLLDLQTHRVTCGLINKINQVGGKKSYKRIKSDIENFVILGVISKMTVQQMINNIFWFIAEDASSGLLEDMHEGNLGLRGRQIVTFDTGQTNEWRHGSLRTRAKRDKRNKYMY